MRSEHNWTPNDYELWFDTENIPNNINIEDVPNLSARLDKLTPLSKKVHIALKTDDKEHNNTISIVTDLTVTVNKTAKRVKII